MMETEHIAGSVCGQRLCLEQATIAADTIDYLNARFSFSEDWDGAEKFAFFAKSGQEDEPAEVPLTDDAITEAQHLNLTAGRWKVWLVGLRTEGAEITQRITTTVAEIRVQLSGVTDGEPFPGETGSAGEQIVAQAIAARNAAQAAAQNAGASANAAAEAAVSAAMSEDNAQESAEAAEESAQRAQTAEGTATVAAASASASASAAAGSAAAAAQSEQTAQTASGTATAAASSAMADAAAAGASAAAAAESAQIAEEAAESVSGSVDKIEAAEFVSKSNRAALYGTVIEDKAYTFADLSTAAIPTEIDGNAAIDGGEVKLTEISGKSIVEGGVIVDSVVGGVKIDGKTLSLPAAQTLRSARDAADKIRFVKQTDGTWNIEKVQNIAAVDLGTRTWNYSADRKFFYSSGYNSKPLASTSVVANALADTYATVASTYVYNNAPSYNMSFGVSNTGTQIYLSNQAYTNAAALRTALSGVMLNYELATPIITTIAEGLREDQVAALAQIGGNIEIVGNTTNAHPSVTAAIQTAIPGGSSDIPDLAEIRRGAALGATAVQPESGKGLFSGRYADLTGKPTIPAPTAYITHADEASVNITLADNTEYTITNCASITLAYPAGRYEAFISVTFGAAVSLTFPTGTKYIGDVPTFAAGETWEISVKNGVVVAGKVE